MNLTINGQEVARWEFSGGNLPEAAEFSRTFEYVVSGPITLEAAAMCNVHGSANTATVTVGLALVATASLHGVLAMVTAN